MRGRWWIGWLLVVLLAVFVHWYHQAAQEPLPKVVALTFDDGPHPVFTPKVLDILKRYQVRATFFLIGARVERYPDIARRIVAEGHEVGNHTYSHPKDLPKEGWEEVRAELERGARAIERVTGVRPKLFRPPFGYINYRLHTLAQLKGYMVVFWTVSADHHDAPTPKAMAERVFRLVHPGAIILMHDGRIPARWKDVAALPLIIEGLRQRGYRFVTVSELLSRRWEGETVKGHGSLGGHP